VVTYTTILVAGRQRVLLIPDAWDCFTLSGRLYRREGLTFKRAKA
jgi:hypothetical protein